MTFIGYQVVPGYPKGRLTIPEPLDSPEREYEVQVRLFSNNDQDGPAAAMQYVFANIAAANSTYAFGSDFDDSAYLYFLDPQRVAKSHPDQPLFLCTLRWRTVKSDEEKEEKDGEDGEKTDDPTKWKPEVNVTTRKVEQAVEDAKYIEGFNGTAHAELEEYEGPVVNSTLQVAVPPATRVRSLRVYEVTTYHPTYFGSTDDEFLDKVNSDEKQFTMPDDTLVTVAPYTAHVEDIVWRWTEINQYQVWRRTVILVIDRKTWRKEYLDRGAFARALDGDPDGRGGTYSAADRPTESPTVRRLLDADDQPVECNLDGDGQPLTEGSEKVYGKWAVIEETEMAGFGITG